MRIADELLQDKALRRTGVRTRRNLSPVRSEDGYDAVIVVIFTEAFRVDEALRVPRDVVNDLFPRRPHVNGRIILRDNVSGGHPDVAAIPLSDAALDA